MRQHEKLKSTLDWILDQRKMKKRMSRVFPSAMIKQSPQPAANEADTEEGLQKAMVDESDDVDDQDPEEVVDHPEDELVKKHWRVWKALKFPLQPVGVTLAEVNVDLWNEFGPILEETRKSLKRSMLFVGGIVRAYMRRGHKKDEWVAMVRRLEARVESPNPAFMDPSFDSSLLSFGSTSSILASSSYVTGSFGITGAATIANKNAANSSATSTSSSASASAPSTLVLSPSSTFSHGLAHGAIPYPSTSLSSSSSISTASSHSPISSTAAALQSAYGVQQIPGSSAIISTIWMAISDIFKYRAVPSVKAPLTKQLNYMYAHYPTYVEFYLPQLANLLLCNKDFPLRDFLFECCRAEPHFAIQAYFLISSMSQVGSVPWQKRCIKILKQLIKAIPIAPHTSSEKGKKRGASEPESSSTHVTTSTKRSHHARDQQHSGEKTHGHHQHTRDPSSEELPTSGEISSKSGKTRKSSKLAQQTSNTPSDVPTTTTATSATTKKRDPSKPSDEDAESADAHAHILTEFPLGLPTDSHNLMLLFSPSRGSATMPIPSQRESHDTGSKYGTLPIAFPLHSESSPSFPGDDAASLGEKSLSKSVPSIQSPFLSEEARLPTNGAPSSDMLPPSSSPPQITISTSSSLKRSSQSKKERSKSTTEAPLSSSSSLPPTSFPAANLDSIPMSHAESSGSAAIPIPGAKMSYKTPPEHLYSLSPMNSPLMIGSHLEQGDSHLSDLTAELKMAVTAAAEAVAHQDSSSSILPHVSSSVTSSDGDSPSSSSTYDTSPPSSSSASVVAADPSEPQTSKIGDQDGYNSDDPEQELKKLTRITKPPSAPRVEKNLEVPEGKEYFFTQIKFMRKLIDVSRKLGELYGKPELYKPQLDRELEALSVYIDSGFAYMPTTSGVRTRVLRFALSDCHPIPTYGRVLYKMIMEVVDLPSYYTKEMADEYVRLNKDIKSIALDSHTHEHGDYHSRETSDTSSSSTSSANGMENRDETLISAVDASGKSFAQGSSSKNGASSASVKQKDGMSAEKRMLRSSASLPAIPQSSSDSWSPFGDSWKDVRRRLKAHSKYSCLPHWEVRAYIVKHGDLVLQEQFVMQLLVQFQHIWNLEGLPLKLCCYNIMATSYQSGLIEVVPNSISLDKLKKVTETGVGGSGGSTPLSLYEFFKKQWPASEEFKKARGNFVASLAAYSVVCYLLQIKDRHNGNIMLNAEGHIFHIDFGYLLARTIKFERAPFKLTDEFIEVLGGDQSKSFRAYCNLCVLGFLAARKHYEKIQLMVEMSSGQGAAIPCLEGDAVAPNLKKRFHLDWTDEQCENYILGLIGDARDNWRTQIYDTYQRIVNNIH